MVISRLDYSNTLLTGLPACAVKPLRMVQDVAVQLVFDQLKRAHFTPLFIELHWLPLDARIKFKTLMLAYKVRNGTAPIYLNALTKAYVTTRSLRSSQDCRLAAPTPRLRQSRLFPCVVPRWRNDLPSATRTGASLSIFKKLLKTQLFREHLLPWHLPCTSLYSCSLFQHCHPCHPWQSLTSGFLLCSLLLVLMLAVMLYPHL